MRTEPAVELVSREVQTRMASLLGRWPLRCEHHRPLERALAWRDEIEVDTVVEQLDARPLESL